MTGVVGELGTANPDAGWGWNLGSGVSDLTGTEREKADALRWPTCIETYDSMLNDAQVVALTSAILLPVPAKKVRPAADVGGGLPRCRAAPLPERLADMEPFPSVDPQQGFDLGLPLGFGEVLPPIRHRYRLRCRSTIAAMCAMPVAFGWSPSDEPSGITCGATSMVSGNVSISHWLIPDMS